MTAWDVPSNASAETIRRMNFGPEDYERKLGLEEPTYSRAERALMLRRIFGPRARDRSPS